MELIVTSKEDLQRLIDEAVTKALAQFKPVPVKELKYLSVAQAAEKLGVSPLTIYRSVKAGKIPAKHLGSKIKIPSTYCDA